MEYSIQELARLSGVTTRTLRWYDQIGLLKPGRVAENGYRRYGPAQVDRLQDILYYRALGVELAQIRACLDDPDFDRLAALRGHLARLEGERARLDGLIRSVTDTIHAEERNEIMQDEQKFEVFKRQAVECNEALYGREVREKYGDAQMDEANAAVMGLTQEQYRTWTGLGEEIRAGLERAVSEKLSPEGEEGRRIAALHRRWLTLTGTGTTRGSTGDWPPSIRRTPASPPTTTGASRGCAWFLRAAVERWAETPCNHHDTERGRSVMLRPPVTGKSPVRFFPDGAGQQYGAERSGVHRISPDWTSWMLCFLA